MGAGHVTDPVVAELVGLYERAQPRLAQLVDAGLRRGLDPERLGTGDQRPGDATAGYRARQQQQAALILQDLRGRTRAGVPALVGRVYSASVLATDTFTGPTVVSGTFGGIHVGAVEVIARNLTDRIVSAIDTTDRNIRAVFDRADRIERAGTLDVPSQIIGRRVNDPYRNRALEEVGQGIVGGDTRRQVSAALAKSLVDNGVTDALTGFVDRSGRRWQLSTYSRMVARTTTRESVTVATRNRLVEGGRDLVDISSHSHPADECTPYDGQTFSLTGATPGYPILDEEPPFHPNCAHVMTPAGADADVWEAELAALL